MKLEVLHIDDCPGWEQAGERLRDALVAVGIDDTVVIYRVLRTAEDAAGVDFAGSPTVLLDGEDLFPSNQRSPDLACRLYPTPFGLAMTPTTEQFIDALVSRGY